MYQPLTELEPVIGMCHATIPVAILLIKQPDLEKQIMQHQEQDAPFHKRHIQPLEPLLAEGPRVAQVLLVKEIACCDEEQRHVEQIDEGHEQRGALGVPRAHQNDGNSLTYRQIGIITFHESAMLSNLMTKVATFLGNY